MATIANLLVRIAADNSQLRSALARSAADLNRFGRNLKISSASLSTAFGAAVPKRIDQIRDRVRQMEADFGRTTTNIRRDFENNLISRSALERQGREAGQALRRGIMSEVNFIQKDIESGLFTPQMAGKFARTQAALLARIPKGLDIDPQHLNNQLLAVADVATSTGRVLTRALTLPLVGFGIAAVKGASDFEKAFQGVRAVTQGTAQELEDLRRTALELGQTRAFSPAEIAQGMQILGQAGLKAGESIRAIGPLIDVATIEEGNLDDATKILIHTMAQFGIVSEKMGENAEMFANKLVAASLSGTVNLTELGNALNYAGTIANQTGQDFSSVLAILTSLGQAGLVASVGGTSLRNMIARLATVTPLAQKALDELARKTGKAAATFRTSTGGFKSLLDIIVQLGKEGQDIDVADIFKIFSLRAGPGFAALKQLGAREIADLTVRIENVTDEARRVAAIKFTGFAAEVKRLSGSFQALAVTIGDTGILRLLTNFVAGIRSVIQNMGDFAPSVLRAAVTWGIFVAAIGPALTLLGAVIRGLVQFRVAAALLAGAGGLGGLAAIVSTGGTLFIGLVALGFVLGKIAGDALDAALAIAKLQTAATGFTPDQLQNFIEATRKSIEEYRALIKKTRDEAQAGFSLVPSLRGQRAQQKALEDIIKYEAEVTRLENQLAALGVVQGDNAKLEAEKNKILAEQEEMWNKIIARMRELPGLSEDLFSPAAQKALAAETNNIAASLRNAIESAKGLADREERLVDPLRLAAEQLAKVKGIMSQIDPSKLRSGLSNAATELERLIRVGTAPDPLAGRDLVRDADNLLARMEAVRDSTEDVNERAALLAPLIREAGILEDKITAEIVKQGDRYIANNSLLQARNRLLRQVPSDPLMRPGIEIGGAAIRDLDLRSRQLVAQMEQAPNMQEWERARDELIAVGQTATQLRALFAILVQTANLTPTQALAAWEAFGEVFDGIMNRVDGLDDSVERLLTTLDGIRDSVGAFGDLADAMDIVNDGLRRMLVGVDQLLSGIQAVIAAHRKVKEAGDATERTVLDLAQAIPGIIGAVAGAINVVKGLFGGLFGGGGPSASEKLTQENTAALIALTQQLKASEIGLAGTREIGIQLEGFKVNFREIFRGMDLDELRKTIVNVNKFNQAVIDQINRQLEGTGLTFADLQRKAEELGISLFDEKGRLDPRQFEILQQAAEASAEALRHFSDSLDTQATLLETKTKLLGPEALTPAAELANQTKILSEALGQGALDILGSIDVTTEEGRQRMRESLLRLIEAIEQGRLSAEALGKFESADELLDFINKYADALNDLEKATEDATKTMQNVPTGFKIALRRFQVQDAVTPRRPGELGDAITGPFGGLPTQASIQLEPVTTGLSEVNETTESGFRDLIATLQTLLGAAEGAPEAPEGAPGADRTLDSLLASLATAAEGMTPEIQRMIDVLTEIVATEAAASMRGFQETIIRRAGGAEPFETVGMRPTDGGMVQFNFGDITIQGADKTAREQWKDIKRVARDEAKSKFGDTRRWGEVP